MEVHGKIPNSRHRSSIPLWPFIKITQRGNTNIILGSVQVLRHRIRGVGGPASIADADDPQNQNDDVTLECVSNNHV